MASVKCFMIEPTKKAKRWFRRFVGTECPLSLGYHSAMVIGDDCEVQIGSSGTLSVPEFDWNDPRWPEICDCGFEFDQKVIRQTFFEQVYLTPEGMEVTTHRSELPGIANAPPGSMYYADWMHRRGPDGRCLVLVLPDGGTWFIDGPSSNGHGTGWTRTGIPPEVTANPSIYTGKYHGWLRNGVLTEC